MKQLFFGQEIAQAKKQLLRESLSVISGPCYTYTPHLELQYRNYLALRELSLGRRDATDVVWRDSGDEENRLVNVRLVLDSRWYSYKEISLN